MTVMNPTLERTKAATRVAKSLKVAAPMETPRARKKAPSKPLEKVKGREARKEKERLTSVQMPRMKPRPPQWPKVDHGQNRQKNHIRNIGVPMEPIVGIPRTE